MWYVYRYILINRYVQIHNTVGNGLQSKSFAMPRMQCVVYLLEYKVIVSVITAASHFLLFTAKPIITLLRALHLMFQLYKIVCVVDTHNWNYMCIVALFILCVVIKAFHLIFLYLFLYIEAIVTHSCQSGAY